jgi:Tol biopolymer transport system component
MTARAVWGVATTAFQSLVLGAILAAAALAPMALASPTTTRVSVSARGEQASRGGGAMGTRWMSADGRFVLFSSRSHDLVQGDGPGSDVFVRDRRRETTALVTVRDGLIGDLSGAVSMSIDGRYVGFSLWNGDQHVAYVRDMRKQTTSPLLPLGVGQPLRNSQSASISRDGRYVAFLAYRASDRPPFDVFVRDRRRGVNRLISRGVRGQPASGNSLEPSISANGRYIAFWSYASNLVRSDANRGHDVFVYDRERRKVMWTTAHADIGPFGRYRPNAIGGSAISANGRYVAFRSSYHNLVHGDTNNQYDIFVHDLRAGTIQRVSVATGGRQVCVPRPQLWVPCHGAFALSPDGHFVAFDSIAPDLVDGDDNQATDVFVHDIRMQSTIRAAVNASVPALSTDGRIVGFNSADRTDVPHDTNGDVDVFVRGPFP